MAPKRGSRVVGSVVKTTKKVVEENLEIAVFEANGNQGEPTAQEKKKVVEVAVVEKEGAEELLPQEEVHLASDGRDKKGGEEEEDKDKGDVEEEGTRTPLKSDEHPRKVEGKEKSVEEIEDTQEVGAEAGGGQEEGKTGRKKGEKKRKRRRRRRGGEGGGIGGEGGYERYVYRVLKQVHPELSVSSKAMAVLDGLMKDMFERLVEEAARLSKYSGKATMSSREIQGAVLLVLPGELGRHAVAEGTKAVSKFMDAH